MPKLRKSETAKAEAIRRAGLDPREGGRDGPIRFADWGKKQCWWIEVPVRLIDDRQGKPHVDFLLKRGSDLHHLRVPAAFLRRVEKDLRVRADGRKHALHLELSDGFEDQCGEGSVSFREYLDGWRSRMSEAIACAVCGRPIEPSASRYVDVDPTTKVKQHVHTECKKPQ